MKMIALKLLTCVLGIKTHVRISLVQRYTFNTNVLMNQVGVIGGQDNAKIFQVVHKLKEQHKHNVNKQIIIALHLMELIVEQLIN